MSKKRKSFWFADATDEQLQWLARRYGTQTTALAVAVRRLYDKEKQNEDYRMPTLPNSRGSAPG